MVATFVRRSRPSCGKEKQLKYVLLSARDTRHSTLATTTAQLWP